MNLIRAKFSKKGDLRYISHLDLMRLMYRALRRADIPVEYTQGFNPQPKISFATALSLGVESEGEYIDIELNGHVDENEFIKKVNACLPEGINMIKAAYVNDKKSVMSLIRWSQYVIKLRLNDDMGKDKLNEMITKVLSMDSLTYKKIGKKKGRKVVKEVEVKGLIKDIDILMYDEGEVILKCTLRTGSDGNLKPEALVQILEKYGELGIKDDLVRIQRLELFVEKNGKIDTPLA